MEYRDWAIEIIKKCLDETDMFRPASIGIEFRDDRIELNTKWLAEKMVDQFADHRILIVPEDVLPVTFVFEALAFLETFGKGELINLINQLNDAKGKPLDDIFDIARDFHKKAVAKRTSEQEA